MNPNIRHVLKTHDDCTQQEWNYGRRMNMLGDVRRCEHGKVQILTAVGPNARVAGPGTHWWRDLSPFWDRKLHKEAVSALDG